MRPKTPTPEPIPTEHRTVVLAHNALHALAEFYGGALREVTDNAARNSALVQQMGGALREAAKQTQQQNRASEIAEAMVRRHEALLSAVRQAVELTMVEGADADGLLVSVRDTLNEALQADAAITQVA